MLPAPARTRQPGTDQPEQRSGKQRTEEEETTHAEPVRPPRSPGAAVSTPSPMAFSKYRSHVPLQLPDRTWPDQVFTEAPRWASVDLRDGNQALIDPMDSERKLRLFETLVEIGFKEIEVGFPSASQPDYDFQRLLIEEGQIPDDVEIQVLVQCRDELIERTFESLRGARSGRSSTSTTRVSTLQRRVVFGLDRAGDHGDRGQRGPPVPQARVDAPGHRDPLRVLAGELHRHRARVRDRDLPGGDGRHRAHAGAAHHLEPAGHRRDVQPQRLRRRDRVVRPDDQGPAVHRPQPASPQRPRHGRRRGRARRSWPAPTGSRGRCSATGNARATWTSSRWP